MTDLLLKLLGQKVNEAQHISNVHPTFHGISLWIVVLLAIGGLALTIFLYERTAKFVSPFRRITLAVLRSIFLLLVLLLLARPVLGFTVEETVRKTLVFLLDTSKSMNIVDPRMQKDDQVRAAIAKGLVDPKGGTTQPVDPSQTTSVMKVPREDLIKNVLKNDKLALMSKLAKDYDLVIFTFDQHTKPVDTALTRPKDSSAGPMDIAAYQEAWKKPGFADRLTADGLTTAMGDAIEEVESKMRGQPLAGIIIASDGGNNSGSDPVIAAQRVKRAGHSIFTWGTGIASPRDVIVSSVFAPPSVAFKQNVKVKVRVSWQSMQGEKGDLVLKLVGADGHEEQVDKKEITYSEDAEQEIEMQFTPQKAGDYELRAEIAARDDETVKDNNIALRQLLVSDQKMKILMVEQSPRWEFKYLLATLARDQEVDFHAVLFEGDKNLAKGKDTPYLEEFPAKKEDLFKYNLIILGDIDPKLLSDEQLDNLSKFVSEYGGSVIFVAGRRFNPAGYRGTILEKMLPVELMPPDFVADTVADKPVRLKITSAGRENAMLRISDNVETSMKLWTNLPPVYWTARVLRKKPAANVLMVDPDDTKKYKDEEMPVMAMQQYGKGQVLYMGTDNTWRWRKNIGDLYYSTLWRQVASQMWSRQAKGSKTTDIHTNKDKYAAGERIQIRAELYEAGTYAPWTAKEHAVVNAIVRRVGPGDATTQTAIQETVPLRPMPDAPGMYQGETVLTVAGNYQATIEKRESEADHHFQVVEPQNEYGDMTAMNEKLLKEIAASSGGTFVREEDLYKLPDLVGKTVEHRQTHFEVELQSSWLYFGLLMLVLTAEWVFRKLCQLK